MLEISNVAPESGLDPAEIRTALADLLASAPFHKSAQLTNFLRFVVEETLDGRGERLKAYTIATAALGRDESFDPQADPIVRVEAARLRRALRTYYADGGAGQPIVIELPTGTYTPVFRAPERQAASPAGWLRKNVGEMIATARENHRLLLLILGIMIVVSIALELVDTLIFDSL